MLRWSEQLTQSFFLSSKDGCVVFFPFGPFKGYFIPRPGFQRVILAFLKRTMVFTIASSIIITVIGASLGFGFTTLTAIGLFDYLLYSILIRRVTRRLLPLPFALGFRFYAQCCDEQRLWEQFFAAIFISVVAVFLLLANPAFRPFDAIVGIALFGLLSLITGLIICVRYRNSEQVAQ